MERPLRVLVAGCGNMGASHARAYHRMPEFQIVGLVSRGPTSRCALGTERGGLRSRQERIRLTATLFLAGTVFVLLADARIARCQSDTRPSEARPVDKRAPESSPASAAFAWPEGKRAALSLTFDDARPSQVDAGLPLLNGHGVKATFYVQPEGLGKRLDGWKAAVASGHEIGNHTISHPCTGNYAFSRENGLEDYTLDRIEAEMTGANELIRRDLGISPTSFAYPCGQTFVGRGLDVRSYVPIVARAFRTGRGFPGEAANDPVLCDPALLLGVAFDGLSWSELLPLVATAAAEGRWLILVGHEIGDTGFQTTRRDTLDALCRYARDPAHGIWLDTVDAVASHLVRSRRALAAPSRDEQ